MPRDTAAATTATPCEPPLAKGSTRRPPLFDATAARQRLGQLTGPSARLKALETAAASFGTLTRDFEFRDEVALPCVLTFRCRVC